MAVAGPAGCGKKRTIKEAASKASVAAITHDLTEGPVKTASLGACQLGPAGITRAAHVFYNASEQSLKDYKPFAATRMRAPTADAMAVPGGGLVRRNCRRFCQKGKR